MHASGRAAVEAARADGRWEAAYAGPATAEVPDDLAAAVAAVPRAQAMFDVLTSTNRFALIHRTTAVGQAGHPRTPDRALRRDARARRDVLPAAAPARLMSHRGRTVHP